MKKCIAILLTLSMTATSMATAFAEETTVAASVESTGTATVDTATETVYDIIVPAEGATLNYTIDPQGLAAIENGKSAELSQLTGGNVFASGFHGIGNKSSVDVKVSAKATAEVASSGDKKIALGAAADIASATVPTVALSLVAAEGSFNEAVTAIEEKALAADAKYSGYGFKDATGTTVTATLKRAEYVATKSDTGVSSVALKTGSKGGAVTFAIAGTCTTGEMVGYAAPTVNVVYSFEKAGTTGKEMTTNCTIASTATAIEFDTIKATSLTPAEPETPAKSTMAASYELPASGSIELDVVLGQDNGVPTKVETNMYGTSTDLMTQAAGWNVTYSDGKLTFGSDISAWMIENAETVKAATFTVTFDSEETADFTFE